jgi:hypothetical protein
MLRKGLAYRSPRLRRLQIGGRLPGALGRTIAAARRWRGAGVFRWPGRSCACRAGHACGSPTAQAQSSESKVLASSRDLVFERCRRLREPCVIQQRVRALPLNTMVRSSSGHCRAPSRGTSRVSHLTPRHTIASALTLAVPSEHETQPTLPRLLHPRPRRPRS